jgi:hypothetical protein
MKVIVAGSRSFSDYQLLKTTLDEIRTKHDVVEIVSGGAHGADSLGEHYAREHGIVIKPFPADWNRYGKAAGYRRNEQMAVYADGLVAFWDNQSRGTKHMIDLARREKLHIKIVTF